MAYSPLDKSRLKKMSQMTPMPAMPRMQAPEQVQPKQNFEQLAGLLQGRSMDDKLQDLQTAKGTQVSDAPEQMSPEDLLKLKAAMGQA